MFEKVGVPILGIVENMAVHVCPNCGHAEHIFGADGGKKMAAEYGVDYLGALPLNMQIREQADSGRPPWWPTPTARSPASTRRWRARWR
jgi:ATP-binding protein involved in chromosome partitioning